MDKNKCTVNNRKMNNQSWNPCPNMGRKTKVGLTDADDSIGLAIANLIDMYH